MDRPLMVPMRQEFDTARIDDFEGTLARKIRDHLASASFSNGDSVAIGVGSRGITWFRNVSAVNETTDGVLPAILTATQSIEAEP